MSIDELRSWFAANHLGLLIGGIVAAAIVAALLLFRWLGRRACERDPGYHTWGSVIGRALSKTTILFIAAAAADGLANYVSLPLRLGRIIDIAFIIAFALQGAIWARELVLGMISRRVADANGGSSLANAMALIQVLVSVTAFAIAIIIALDNLGVNVTALVAGLGIGGIAIGLAAQGIFSDLFAALSILFDKPFKKGDTIRYDNSTGTVERIGLKTTRLRSLTGEQLIMANTKLLEREIHNLAEAKARRITLYLAVGGEASVESIDAVCGSAEAAVAAQKGCKLVRCALSGTGGGALTFDLVYDDATRDNDKLAADRAAILRSLIEALQGHKLYLMRASDQQTAPLPF